MSKKLLIAIDGPSASGKGTISKLLSEKFSIPHLNTGGLYRGLAYKAIQKDIDLNNEKEIINLSTTLNENDINNPIIFTEEIGGKAAIVAKIQSVRDVLLKYQRDFANQDGGAILDGRDIGTVVCPNANYKFFITASSEERAKRRFKEMKEKGQNVEYENILVNLKERDEKDMNREASPFKKADDAILIDTTDKNVNQVLEEILAFIK